MTATPIVDSDQPAGWHSVPFPQPSPGDGGIGPAGRLTIPLFRLFGDIGGDDGSPAAQPHPTPASPGEWEAWRKSHWTGDGDGDCLLLFSQHSGIC